ncbi:hypothetical protein GCM10010353_66500 [Streptomyces chryseus]|nr:hypothetical protein GCM10010353_66500 [Streptomyces chryseus]
MWAHVKRRLANLAITALDRLETLVRNRLKRLQYRPDTLDGFRAGTGFALDAPTPPPQPGSEPRDHSTVRPRGDAAQTHPH